MRSQQTSAAPFVRRIVVMAVVASMLVIAVASGGIGQVRADDGRSTQTVASVSVVDGGGQLVTMRIVIEPGVTLGARRHLGSSTLVLHVADLLRYPIGKGACHGGFGRRWRR